MSSERENAGTRSGENQARPDNPLGPASRFDPLIYTLLVAIVAILIAFLPASFISISGTLFKHTESLYYFPNGAPADPDQGAADSISLASYNIALTNVNEEHLSVDVALSGDRYCRQTCEDGLEFTLVSYDASIGTRRGLGQWLTIPIPDSPGTFAVTGKLPISGWPGGYPFDTYKLRLGIGASVLVDGTLSPLEQGSGWNTVLTVQNATDDLIMRPPRELPVAEVDDPRDDFTLLGAAEIELQRPIHLRVLSVALFVMMAVSTILGLFFRSLPAVVFGNAGMMLGIFSIRSVVVPAGVKVITAVDVASQLLILLMLVGIVVRIAAIIRVRSNLPLIPGFPRKRKG